MFAHFSCSLTYIFWEACLAVLHSISKNFAVQIINDCCWVSSASTMHHCFYIPKRENKPTTDHLKIQLHMMESSIMFKLTLKRKKWALTAMKDTSQVSITLFSFFMGNTELHSWALLYHQSHYSILLPKPLLNKPALILDDF